MRTVRIPPTLHALLLAPSIVLVTAVVRQHALGSPVFPAGITAVTPGEALPVRFAEGMVHGFLELRSDSGTLLAHADLLQVARDSGVESRLVFHFPDSSVFTETVRFTQRGVFKLQHYHLVQRGPAFETDLEVTLDRSGRYDVTARSRKDGEVKRYQDSLELPPDVYNGMVILIAKNLPAKQGATVHIVAFTPKPRLVKLEIAPAGSQPVTLGRHTETATHYTLKPKLGPVVGVAAKLTGQMPPDSHVWIVTDGVPAFVRFQGPLYSGPVWRLSLTSPKWPG